VSAALPQIVEKQGTAVRIAIARDRAFGFYYADDLDELERQGAELVPIDTLRDPHLPDVDGLIIGGGFPELFLEGLEANATLRNEIRNAIENGLPTYAECGGLMYLSRTLSYQGQTCHMVGIVPGDVVMHSKPVGRGYVRLQETGASPWPCIDEQWSGEIHAHEFHYSSLDNLSGELNFAYSVKRGHGIDGHHDGLVYKNLLASYTHLRSVKANNWAARFVAFVRQIAASRPDAPKMPQKISGAA
jgi:cobyrinic acid a,c-diamide synthase